ncbi:ABC transporter ATP-binding protein [Candidatus Dependentiae bacterium]|nr:ABC transporter ATP-binding protein [Candidatus Dependentiae bacterium]
MASMPVLQVKQLYKAFGDYRAVNYISFELHPGEIVGLLGSNGAGKTTTIQMLLGTMTPTSGSIVYFDKDLATHRSEVLQHVSFASTYVRLQGKLSIYENLDFFGKIYGLSALDRRVRIEQFLKFFDMWRLKDRYAGGLSAGETTRVMLAKAFVARPKVVLLDEPTASLDPDVAHDVRAFVKEQQRQHGVSILFTSHNMDEVAAVCSRVLVLKKGTIIANDSPSNLACSIAATKLKLSISESQTHQVERFIAQRGLLFSHEGSLFEIAIDEHAIGDFLLALAREQITYCQITVEKPTLESYFLHIAKNK